VWANKGLDGFQAGIEGLLAEVGAGVDDDSPGAVADGDGGTQTAVSRIIRAADLAVAADGGYADTGARAKDTD
jgi:hypothetical protein